MYKPRIELDLTRNRVILDGRSVTLQQKALRVLSVLLEEAPQPVSRHTLIEKVWQGNYWTGDKGLNQAIWSIRTALNDDAQEPQYIATLPRQGYRFLLATSSNPPKTRRVWVAAAALIIAAVTFVWTTQSEPPNATPKGIEAYLHRGNIVVDTADGCRRIFAATGEKRLGSPVLSKDGSHVAFSVTDPKQCRLVTLDIASGERQDFGDCPVG